MKIEDVFFPNHGELEEGENCYNATIVDSEIDPINCRFIGDGCVTLDTSELTYITLTVSNLYQLIELIDEADVLIDNEEFIEE